MAWKAGQTYQWQCRQPAACHCIGSQSNGNPLAGASGAIGTLASTGGLSMVQAFQAAGAVQLLVRCLLGGRYTRLLTQAAGALTNLVSASVQGSEAAAAAAAEAAEAGAVPRLF